jgi:hypothetical protein
MIEVKVRVRANEDGAFPTRADRETRHKLDKKVGKEKPVDKTNCDEFLGVTDRRWMAEYKTNP